MIITLSSISNSKILSVFLVVVKSLIFKKGKKHENSTSLQIYIIRLDL